MVELKQVLRVLLRRWWLVVIPIAIVGVGVLPGLLRPNGVTGGFATSFKYSASQALNLPQRDGDYQDVWLASEFVVNAFTQWVRSSTFRDELQSALGEDFDLGGLNIASDNARSIGVVQMSYPDEDGLRQIAESAIMVLRERNAAYFPHLEGEVARVTIIDAPSIVANPPPLTNRFAPLLQVGLALLGGVGLALGAHYLDARIYDAHEVVQEGLMVLGQIPRS